MAINIRMETTTRVIVGASINVIYASGAIDNIGQPALLGISYAHHADYLAGYPNWKENYVDSKGNYVQVSQSNQSFGRDMADTLSNYEYDYILYVALRNPSVLSEVYAERLFRLNKTGLFAVTDNMVYKDISTAEVPQPTPTPTPTPTPEPEPVPTPMPTPDAKWMLSVYVADNSTKMPINGAKVTFNARDHYTESAGVASEIVPVGTYNVLVSAAGYVPQQRSVTVIVPVSGTTKMEEFYLYKSGGGGGGGGDGLPWYEKYKTYIIGGGLGLIALAALDSRKEGRRR